LQQLPKWYNDIAKQQKAVSQQRLQGKGLSAKEKEDLQYDWQAD